MADVPTIDSSLSITTTKRKLKYMKPLQDFMQLVGKFMRYRMDPTYADNTPNYYEEIKEFVELYTDIPGHGYWDKLTEEQQLTFCKFLRFSDDMPVQFNILCDIENAKIVVVLNNEAHVTTRTSVKLGPAQVESVEEKAVFGQGKCFGGHGKFNEAYRQLVKKEEEAKNTPAKNLRLRNKEAARQEQELADMLARGEKPQEEIPDTVVAYMQKGTFMQISVRDYLEQVLGIERKKEEEIDPETDEQIAGKNKEDMTENDYKMVAVKRAAKRKLAETMFNFMSKFELIPHNADIVSSEFVVKGSINRRLSVEPGMYYVVISGIACLEAAKVDPNRRNKLTAGSITLARRDPAADEMNDRGDGLSSIAFARKNMKVFRMYPGTILALEDENFAVGTALDPRYADEVRTRFMEMYPGMPPPVLPSDTDESRARFLPPIDAGTLSYEEEKARERTRRQLQAQFEKECIPHYKLQMLVESPLTFLAIPQKLFYASLKELPKASSEDIRLQLKTSNELVYEQVSKLGEWVRGGGTLPLQIDLDDDVFNEEVAWREAEAAARAPEVGSVEEDGGGKGGGPHNQHAGGGGDFNAHDLAKSITMGFARKSSSPVKKGGQSRFQQDRREKERVLEMSKSTGSLTLQQQQPASTRGILKVGAGTVNLGRGRNKHRHDILSQSMTLKEPLDGTFGEEHLKQAIRMKEAQPRQADEGKREGEKNGPLPGGGGGDVDDDELSHLSNLSEPPTLDWVASSSTIGSRGNQ